VRAWANTPPAVHELPIEMVASRAGPNRAAVCRAGSLIVERRAGRAAALPRRRVRR
jgi:hypothetical protein